MTPYEAELDRANNLQVQRDALVIVKNSLGNAAAEDVAKVMHPDDVTFVSKIADVVQVPQIDVEEFMTKTDRLTKAVTAFLSLGDDSTQEQARAALVELHESAFTITEITGLAQYIAANDERRPS